MAIASAQNKKNVIWYITEGYSDCYKNKNQQLQMCYLSSLSLISCLTAEDNLKEKKYLWTAKALGGSKRQHSG